MHNDKIETHPIVAEQHRRRAGVTAGDFWSNVKPGKHRCSFGSSGRCPCGLHRAPERAVYVAPRLTDEERLSIDI